MVTAKALMWYSGSTPSTRSAGVSACSAPIASALAVRLACVSITPLGRPVVPEVYISKAVASGRGAGVVFALSGSTSVSWSTASTGARGESALTFSTHSPLARINLLSLWSST